MVGTQAGRQPDTALRKAIICGQELCEPQRLLPPPPGLPQLFPFLARMPPSSKRAGLAYQLFNSAFNSRTKLPVLETELDSPELI